MPTRAGRICIPLTKPQGQITYRSVSGVKVKDMKKLLLAAIAATGLLASCGGDGVFASATMQSVDFSSDKTLRESITGSDGHIYPAGTEVICDNMTTNISAYATYSGSVSKLTLQLKGWTTGTYKNVNVYPSSVIDTDGVIETEWFPIAPGMAPLNITSQAITVTPTPVNVTDIKGYTYMRAQANDGSNVVETPYAIPVVDCY